MHQLRGRFLMSRTTSTPANSRFLSAFNPLISAFRVNSFTTITAPGESEPSTMLLLNQICVKSNTHEAIKLS
jgi:hypothetical protein